MKSLQLLFACAFATLAWATGIVAQEGKAPTVIPKGSTAMLDSFFPAGYYGLGHYAPITIKSEASKKAIEDLAKGEFEAAYAHFIKTALEKPYDPGALKVLVDAAVRSTKAKDLEGRIEKLRTKEDSDPLRYASGWLLLAGRANGQLPANSVDRAYALFQKIKEVSSEYVLARASCASFMSRFPEARDVLQGFLADHPSDVAVRLTLADVYLNWRGTQTEKKVTLGRALKEAQRVLELDGRSPGGYVLAGMATARLGNREEAKAYYRQALPLLDPNSKTYKNLLRAVNS